MMTTVNNNLNFKKKRRAFDVALNVLIVIFCFIVAFEIWFSSTHVGIYVVHSSMSPTLIGAEEASEKGGDYVYANTRAKPTYGDIIVINDSRSGIRIIKRAIAFGGDTVRIDSGVVYIKYGVDGEFERLNEPYVAAENNLTKDSRDEVVVAEGYVYLLGDNRDISDDSRRHGAYLLEDTVGVVTKFSLSIKSFTTSFYNFFNF